MNTKIKVLLTGIIGMGLVATPILTSAATSNDIQAVSSATSKQSPAPVPAKTIAAPTPSKTTSAQSTKATSTTPTKKEVWTLEKVKTYNGKSGKPAYIVVSGVIYDVTNVSNWKNGSHNGLSAGADLTTAFSKSPHSAKLLQQLKVIAKIGDPIPSPVANDKSQSTGSLSTSKPAVTATNSVKTSSLIEKSNKSAHDDDDDSDDDNDNDEDDDNDDNDDGEYDHDDH